MSVGYFLVNSKTGEHTDPYQEYPCFGRLFWKDDTWLIFNSNNKWKEVYYFDKLYYLYDEEDLSKSLVEKLVEKFPWMKDIFTFEEFKHGNASIKSWAFDLTKPADTVWFCLNTVRLIQQCEYSEKFEKVIESGVDFWKSIVVCNSTYYSKSWDGKNGNWYYYDLEETCLLSMAYMSEEVIKAVLEDPIQVLNKLPSVIESKSGFKPIVGYLDEDENFINDADSNDGDSYYLSMLLVMENLLEKDITQDVIDDCFSKKRDIVQRNITELFGLTAEEVEVFNKIYKG